MPRHAKQLGQFGILSLLMLCGICLGADPAPQKTLPEFGLKYVPPAGWAEQTPDMLNIVRVWSLAPKQGKISNTLTLRCEPSAGGLERSAAALAEQYVGAVRDEKAEIDGAPAKVLWISRPGLDVEMRALVAQHNGLTYVVELTGPVGAMPRETLDQFVKDMKWDKLESITDHMRQDGPRMEVMGGRVSVMRPEIMRPAVAPSLQKPDRFIFMTPRAKPTEAEFICVMGLSVAVKDRPFAELASVYLAAMNQQDPSAKLQWEKNDSTRRLSNMVTMQKTDPAGLTHNVTTIVGMAKLDGLDQYLVVNFLINTEDAAKRKVYQEAARRIFDSIKVPG